MIVIVYMMCVRVHASLKDNKSGCSTSFLAL